MNEQNDNGVRLDEASSRLHYAAPVLIILGDIRQLTLSGSAGSGDSGGIFPNQRL
jgi:hypothetical protein